MFISSKPVIGIFVFFWLGDISKTGKIWIISKGQSSEPQA